MAIPPTMGTEVPCCFRKLGSSSSRSLGAKGVNTKMKTNKPKPTNIGRASNTIGSVKPKIKTTRYVMRNRSTITEKAARVKMMMTIKLIR